MKVTVVIADSLRVRATRVAKARGITLREFFEQSLRVAIEVPSVPRYELQIAAWARQRPVPS